jgi:hypothetical protein
MTSTTETVANAIDLASKATDCAIDIYTKLQKSFKLSDKTKKQSDELESEIKKLTFNNFDEKYSCKSVKEIPIDEFEAYVTNRLQKRLNLPDDVKESLLDGLYVGENEEKVKQFHFKDGNGDIHHGRFVTMKRNGKRDLAYAMYSLSFELAEKEMEHGSYEWWFYVLPVWNVTHTKEIQNLSESQKDNFSQWCQVKLYDCVAQECLKE